MKNKYKTMVKIFAIIMSLYIPFSSCSNDDKIAAILNEDQPVLLSSNPEMNAIISPATEKLTLTFNRGIVLKNLNQISLNDTVAISSSIKENVLTLNIPPLEENEDYTLTIFKGAIMANVGVSNQEDLVVKFSTTEGTDIKLVSSKPEVNTTISPRSAQVDIFFDQKIKIVDATKISINNGKLPFKPYETLVKLSLPLGYLTEKSEYTIKVAPGAISTSYGRVNKEQISITFTTEENPIAKDLVVKNASREAKNVYNFLYDNFGLKTVSGTMANVSWNINEAQWVYKHMGEYPALNCFDYVHLNTNWVDYTDTKVVEDWWSKNGLVSAMWHWNVPVKEGSNEFAFYTEETEFNLTEALKDGTYENGIIRADLNQIADRLLLLKQKNIPVIWRPLHEAAGAWFWWGAQGAEAYTALWQLMFKTFEEKGLNNLIWVWTAEANDSSWYPGDEYVDIIGRDVYNKTALPEMQGEYSTLIDRYPNKIIALSEFGNIANISDQLDGGVIWSWAMPWYDYDRTLNINNGSFAQKQHEFADFHYWEKMFSNENVIFRSQMPSLK